MSADDTRWMERALELARHAQDQGEVPVGAVIVLNNEVLGEGWNQPISTNDPTAHAEIVALRAAARRLSNYRLSGSTLYVTLEPCPMCAGAMVHARVARIVYGASDPIAGSAGTVYNILQSSSLNHRAEVTPGVLADICAQELRAFFKSRR